MSERKKLDRAKLLAGAGRLTEDAGWQDISTAPTGDDQSYILVATGNPYKPCEVVRYGWNEGSKVVWFNDDVAVEATHWLPLPPPPTQEAETK